MFEPLKDILDKHGTNFAGILHDVRKHLAQIVENTTAKMTFDRFGTYSISGKQGTLLELSNQEGCYWKVIHSSAVQSAPGKKLQVEVYVGADNPESLVDAFINLNSGNAGTTHTVGVSTSTFYVPPRSTLFVRVIGEVAAGEEDVSYNVQVERLIECPEYTGAPTTSYDVSEIDKRLSEPERHRVPRTRKPNPTELRPPSIHQ